MNDPSFNEQGLRTALGEKEKQHGLGFLMA
jgi:hypothetical protein